MPEWPHPLRSPRKTWLKFYDALVIGGGIAGASLGYEFAADRTVGLVDMQSTLAFHTIARSVAASPESSGGPVMRALTTASRAFLEDPPQVFEAKPLSPLLPEVRLVEPDEAQQICPVLQPGYGPRASRTAHSCRHAIVRRMRRARVQMRHPGLYHAGVPRGVER